MKIKHNLRESKSAPRCPEPPRCGRRAPSEARRLRGARRGGGSRDGAIPRRPGPAAATFPPPGSLWCSRRPGLRGSVLRPAGLRGSRGCGSAGVRGGVGGAGEKVGARGGFSGPFGGTARAACVAGRGIRPAGLRDQPPHRSPTLFPSSAGRGERRGGRGSISRGLRMPDRPAGRGRRENIKKRKEFGVSLRNRRNKTLS